MPIFLISSSFNKDEENLTFLKLAYNTTFEYKATASMNHKPAPVHRGGSLFSPRTLVHSSQMQAQMASPMAFVLVKPLAARGLFLH